MSTTNQVSTDREIAARKPRDRRIEVAVRGARGLSIRVAPSGKRVFEYHYVAPNGKRRRMKLGLYPALKLADARNKALKLRSTVIDDSDPLGEQAAAKLVLRTGETVNRSTISDRSRSSNVSRLFRAAISRTMSLMVPVAVAIFSYAGNPGHSKIP